MYINVAILNSPKKRRKENIFIKLFILCTQGTPLRVLLDLRA
jgi:hypothetical protein